MHENFIALEQEKRDRIINAAMGEFSAKGFKNASTNEIVKKAEISKGALFHYFSSKLDLFAFLYRYSMDLFLETIEPYLDNMSDDVFERWIEFATLKLRVAAQHPDMSDFMLNAFRDDAKEAQELLKGEFERFSGDFTNKIYDGLDFSRFKPDVDTQKALQMIWWILEGFSFSKQKEPIDMQIIKSEEFIQAVICEMDDYLGMLKKSFYKEEYLK